MRWEVSIPATKGRATACTVTVDAENWLAALKAGLTKAGDQTPLGSSFHCSIGEDESVSVSDFARSCIYQLRPMADGAQPRPPAPRSSPSRSAADKPVVESFAPPKVRSVSIPADPVPRAPSAPSLPAPPVPPPAPVAVPPPPAAIVPAPAIPGVAAPTAAAAARASTTPASVAPPQAPPAPRPAPAAVPSAPPPPPLPQHQIFAQRDENPDAGNPLTYRDRLFAVSPGTRPEDAVTLLKHYFAEIQLEIAGHGPGKFINLAVFDHIFRGRPERPAIAALSWKDWRGADPEITFPAAAPAPSPTPAKGLHIERGVTPVERRRRSSHDIPIADTTADDRLAEVFEAMQDLFLLRTQREAAAFALDLALAKIPCEAGSTVLNDLDRGDLFFAAVRGPAAEHLTGMRLEQGKGIIGAAARSLETIAIADVAQDPRFFPDYDRMTGFETRTVLCAPLHYEGRAVGAIELLNKQKGGAFTQSDVNVLSYIAENLGNFVATSLPETDEPPENPRKK